MSTIKIEKGIPLTSSYNIRNGRKYPFNEMEPGDSFSIPAEIYSNKIGDAARSYGNKHSQKYAIRKQADGSFRCWRIS